MKKNLLFIGDSLTEWFDWDRRFPAYDVVNLGISGETVEEMLDRRDLIREAAGTPDIVFLMTGINNVLQERYAITGPCREIVRNFTTWWKSATVVVQSLLPVEFTWIGNDTIRDLNRALQAVARDASAEFLDVYAAFMDNDGKVKPGLLSDDGVHLAAGGYEMWAQVIEDYLSKK